MELNLWLNYEYDGNEIDNENKAFLFTLQNKKKIYRKNQTGIHINMNIQNDIVMKSSGQS
jgi:hypothetical protein